MNNYFVAAVLAAAVHVSAAGAGTVAQIQSFGPESFRQIVESQKQKAFVVLVWSLDCDYCQQSFQALADAKKRYGLNVITIATDPADDAESARLVAKKLAASGLPGNAWAFGPWASEQLRYSIDPKWRGELPRSYWFRNNGKPVAHSGVITPETVAKQLAK